MKQIGDRVPFLAEDICPLLLGAMVPKLTLATSGGKPFDLNAAIAEKPTVLIFYRGGWCPICNRHFSQLRGIVPQLIQLGYQIIAISPDKPSKLGETIQKQELDFLLLSDSKMVGAQLFGIAFQADERTLERHDLEDASGEKHHWIPVPAVFIVGKDGIIRFEYVNPNYRVRMNPDLLLAAAKTALE